jgi:hypothetical protein
MTTASPFPGERPESLPEVSETAASALEPVKVAFRQSPKLCQKAKL